MPEAAHAHTAQRLQILRVLWLAHCGSVAVFVVVCVMLRSGGPTANAALVATLRPIFWVLALALATVSIWWRRSFVVAAPPPGPPGAGGQAPDQAWARLQSRCVIVWAMSEAVAVLGLVLGVLTRDVGEFLPFASAAVALLYVHRPAAWRLDSLRRAGSDPRAS
jgi:hypothetical protein